MRATHLLLIFLATSLLSCRTGAREKQPTGFLDRTVIVSGIEYRYQLYVPRAYDPSMKWPAILFLHGAGERGSDGLFGTAIALANAIRRNPDLYPALVIFPQCRKNQQWTGVMQDLALATLEATQKNFSIDPDRLLLTGISMGGAGSWLLALRQPDRFAAVAPICGWVVPPPALSQFARDISADGIEMQRPYQSVAAKLKNLPIWIAHGSADTTVPVEESRAMAGALSEVGATVRYVELPGAGHNAWDPTFLDPRFAEWLLQQRRSTGK